MGECLIIRSGGGTDTSNANATAAQVLSGYTCYVKDTKITGTMTNRGTVNQSLNPGGSYTIPVGYHSGSGKVTVSSLSANTSGTANAGRILSGRTAWVGGSRLTGTMTNRGAVSHSLAANGSYTIPAGWHNGSGKVNQSLTTQGAKSVTPKTTNQTACSANRWTTGTITIVGSSSLTAGNIKNGVTIFGVKGTFQGIVDTGPINLFTGRNGYLQYGERNKVESTVIGGVFLTWKSYAGSPWYWSGWSTMTVSIPKAINGITEVKIDGWLKTRTNGAIDITYYDDSNWMSWYSSSDMWWEADDSGYSSFWKYGETIPISSSKQVHWINFQMNYDRQDWVWCARCIIKYNP